MSNRYLLLFIKKIVLKEDTVKSQGKNKLGEDLRVIKVILLKLFIKYN